MCVRVRCRSWRVGVNSVGEWSECGLNAGEKKDERRGEEKRVGWQENEKNEKKPNEDGASFNTKGTIFFPIILFLFDLTDVFFISPLCFFYIYF